MALLNQYNDDSACTITSEETLTPPPPMPLPTLPFDLVVEILFRLPVKFLLQFRSVCKLWNSLISDSKFAYKHLGLSTTQRINSVYYSYSRRRYILESYTLDSNVRQVEYAPNGFEENYHPYCACSIVGSCNGILCLALFDGISFVPVLWNPSIRKFKELPSIENPKDHCLIPLSYGFGYDHVNDSYKVVAVFKYSGVKTEVRVHTVGTNFWKSIQEFPFGCDPLGRSGTFVSGTINWLPFKDGRVQSSIVSFDLRTESYQEILQPNYGKLVADADQLSLGVLRDCLCLFCYHDVWIMKEFGNKESWTKLCTSLDSYKSNCYSSSKAMHMFSDDLVLLVASCSRADLLMVYDSKTGTVEFISFKDKGFLSSRDGILKVCVESLISP